MSRVTRTYTRSQRNTRSQGNQPGPSQAPLLQDDCVEDQNAPVDHDEDVDMEDGDLGGLAQVESDILRKAAGLARLALFNEQKRTPLRREEIIKKVIGSQTRAFNRVFDHANQILRRTFGMELIELPTRANISQDPDGPDGPGDELDVARRTAGVRRKVTTAGSKTYMLRSTLDPQLLEIAARTDERILEIEAGEAPSDDDSDDDDLLEGGYTPRFYGSIISWTHGEQPGAIGILYVILALILVHGRVIRDMDLRMNLRRLRLPTGGEVTFSALSTHKTLTIDQYLSSLMRQNYIDREQIGEGKSKGIKRGRVVTQAPQDDEEGAAYQWRWGPRAYCEISEKAVAKFIAEFMFDDRDADADEEAERPESSRRARNKEQRNVESKVSKMLDGIEKAAGGNLTGLR